MDEHAVVRTFPLEANIIQMAYCTHSQNLSPFLWIFTAFCRSFKRPFKYRHTNLRTRIECGYAFTRRKNSKSNDICTQHQQQQHWRFMLCPFLLTHSLIHSILHAISHERPDTELNVFYFSYTITTSQPTHIQNGTHVHTSRVRAAFSKLAYTYLSPFAAVSI